MKAVDAPPLRTHRIVWCAPGEVEISHLVQARDEYQARRISMEELRDALGPALAAWWIKRVL